MTVNTHGSGTVEAWHANPEFYVSRRRESLQVPPPWAGVLSVRGAFSVESGLEVGEGDQQVALDLLSLKNDRQRSARVECEEASPSESAPAEWTPFEERGRAQRTKSSQSPLVSIITPVLNRVATIEICLESVASKLEERARL